MAGPDRAGWFEREEFIGQISDIRVQNLQVEREAVQKRTFTRWMNLHLDKCDPPLQVQDLFQDIQDGHVLMALLEELSGCRLLQGFRKSSHRIFRLNNIAKVLNFLEERNVKLVSIDAADVADGNPSIVLGLIWNIILFFQIQELTGNIRFPSSSSLSSLPPDPEPPPAMAARENRGAIRRLLQWVQRRTRRFGVAVQDFGGSWTSGLAFLAVIKSIDGGLVDLRRALLRGPRENLEEAFRVAHFSLGIPRLLEPEDVTGSSPDEQSIIMYVSQFLEHFPGREEEEEPRHLIGRSVSLGRLSDGEPDRIRTGVGGRVWPPQIQEDRPPKVLVSWASEDRGGRTRPPTRSWSSEDWLRPPTGDPPDSAINSPDSGLDGEPGPDRFCEGGAGSPWEGGAEGATWDLYRATPVEVTPDEGFNQDLEDPGPDEQTRSPQGDLEDLDQDLQSQDQKQKDQDHNQNQDLQSQDQHQGDQDQKQDQHQYLQSQDQKQRDQDQNQNQDLQSQDQVQGNQDNNQNLELQTQDQKQGDQNPDLDQHQYLQSQDQIQGDKDQDLQTQDQKQRDQDQNQNQDLQSQDQIPGDQDQNQDQHQYLQTQDQLQRDQDQNQDLQSQDQIQGDQDHNQNQDQDLQSQDQIPGDQDQNQDQHQYLQTQDQLQGEQDQIHDLQSQDQMQGDQDQNQDLQSLDQLQKDQDLDQKQDLQSQDQMQGDQIQDLDPDQHQHLQNQDQKQRDHNQDLDQHLQNQDQNLVTEPAADLREVKVLPGSGTPDLDPDQLNQVQPESLSRSSQGGQPDQVQGGQVEPRALPGPDGPNRVSMEDQEPSENFRTPQDPEPKSPGLGVGLEGGSGLSTGLEGGSGLGSGQEGFSGLERGSVYVAPVEPRDLVHPDPPGPDLMDLVEPRDLVHPDPPGPDLMDLVEPRDLVHPEPLGPDLMDPVEPRDLVHPDPLGPDLMDLIKPTDLVHPDPPGPDPVEPTDLVHSEHPGLVLMDPVEPTDLVHSEPPGPDLMDLVKPRNLVHPDPPGPDPVEPTDLVHSEHPGPVLMDPVEPMDLFYPDPTEPDSPGLPDTHQQGWPLVLSVSALQPAPGSETPPPENPESPETQETPETPETQGPNPEGGKKEVTGQGIGDSQDSPAPQDCIMCGVAIGGRKDAERRPDSILTAPALRQRRGARLSEPSPKDQQGAAPGAGPEDQRWAELQLLLLLWLLLYCCMLLPQAPWGGHAPPP